LFAIPISSLKTEVWQADFEFQRWDGRTLTVISVSPSNWARWTGMSGRDEPEWVGTIGRNHWARWTKIPAIMSNEQVWSVALEAKLGFDGGALSMPGRRKIVFLKRSMRLQEQRAQSASEPNNPRGNNRGRDGDGGR
jgi:hypothetical protein